MPTDYTPETFNTGDTFEAADATAMSQQINEEETINAAQQVEVDAAQADLAVAVESIINRSPLNLLMDPSYERDSTWWAAELARGGFALSTDQAVVGTHSMKITGSRSHYPNVTVPNTTGFDTTYGVIRSEAAGRLYRMSCKVWRKVGNTSGGFIRGQLKLQGAGGADTLNGQGPTDAVNQSDMPAGAWFTYTTYFVVPTSGTNYPYYGVYPAFTTTSVDTADEFYVDEMRFEDMTNSPLEILAPAPSGDRTKDSLALQGCSDIAQLYRGTVKLRAGTYLIDVVTQALAQQPRFVGQGKQLTRWDGTLKFQGHGHSNAFSGGFFGSMNFVGSHAGSAAVELNACTDVHWDDIRVEGTYDNFVWFRNELSGDFTEMCNGKADIYSTVTTPFRYTAPVAGWASFHWSGPTGGTVVQGAGPVVLIESLARPYNAPLTLGVWSNSATYPVIQHNGDAQSDFHGVLTVEQTTAAAALAAGTSLPFAGPVLAYMGPGLTLSEGTLMRLGGGLQGVSGGALTQLPFRALFKPTKASTVSAAGTLTMTIGDAQVQEFTGSTTHTVKLPTTGVTAGMQYTIVNNSSGTITVQSSGANSIVALATGRLGVYTARIDSPTAAADWQLTAVIATTASAYTTLLLRDTNANAFADAFISSVTSTATAAGTLTMTVADTAVQVLTGSTTHTVKLPTTSVLAGQFYVICNQSSGAVTVQSSGANTIQVLAAGEVGIFFAQTTTPTTASHWVSALTASPISSGVYASAPASAKAGRLYIPSDVPALLYDNGATIDRFILPQLKPATAVPTTGWTTVNLGSSTFAADKDGRLFTMANIAANSIALEYRTLAAGNYTATAYLDRHFYRAGLVLAGILLREASTGKIITFGPGWDAGTNGHNVSVVRHTTSAGVTAYSSYSTEQALYAVGGIPNWYRIRDDGTTLFFEYSFNGVDWIELFSEGRTAYFAGGVGADGIGWGGSNNASGKTATMRLRSWLVA